MRYEALRIENVAKYFESMEVLEHVNLNLFKGEILGLVGENGAGKSTLMKILSGIYKKDSGRMYVDGKLVNIDSIAAAYKEGIVCVQQDSELFLDMTVAENLFLGFQNKYERILFNKKSNEKLTAEVLKKYSINIASNEKLNSLSRADREMLEIVKAVVSGAKILLMDEPTASLSSREMKKVHNIVRELRNIGKSVIYISQDINELMSLCDRIAIIRNGAVVSNFIKAEFDKDKIITIMVGKEILKPKNIARSVSDETVLRVDGLSGCEKVCNVSFSLRKGEILGIAGIRGSGKTELLKLLFGIERMKAGTIHLYGRICPIVRPESSIRNRIAYVPSERIDEGIFMILNGMDNMQLDNVKGTLHWGFISSRLQKYVFEIFSQKLNIDKRFGKIPARKLSGGTQQKLMLARGMVSKPLILLLDEPTKGIDVSSKSEIYKEILELSAQGTAIIAAFSETSEMLSMCDRILVMGNGLIVAELERNEFTEEELIGIMT